MQVLRAWSLLVLFSPPATSFSLPSPKLNGATSTRARNIQTMLGSSSGVLWDVDGTLVESTDLAFTATNEVLAANGHAAVSVEQYKAGCKFTTPARFSHHIGEPAGGGEGPRLGDEFDRTYVVRVSKETAGLFDGIDRLLRSIALSGHPQGVLSNACGAYVRAVVAANELDEVPGQRMALFGVVRGADEVPAAKPAGDGLLACCEVLQVDPAASVYVGDSASDGLAARAAGMKSVGVLWGACSREVLDGNFDELVEDVPSLIKALRDAMGD